MGLSLDSFGPKCGVRSMGLHRLLDSFGPKCGVRSMGLHRLLGTVNLLPRKPHTRRSPLSRRLKQALTVKSGYKKSASVSQQHLASTSAPRLLFFKTCRSQGSPRATWVMNTASNSRCGSSECKVASYPNRRTLERLVSSWSNTADGLDEATIAAKVLVNSCRYS
jgi:hypothetical protein